MPTRYPVTLKKSGFQNFMGGVFSTNKTMRIGVNAGGVVEACYDREMSTELMKMAVITYWDDSVGFICGVNHLLLRKVGIGTKLQNLAGLQSANMVDQMQQVYDRFVPTAADKSINVSSSVRIKIMDNWTRIKSSQSILWLLAARTELVAMLVKDSLARDIQQHLISKRLAETLQKMESPTDNEVMKRLKKMGPQMIEHLDGRKLSYDEMLQQFAELHGQ